MEREAKKEVVEHKGNLNPFADFDRREKIKTGHRHLK
jgi:hypothetical protein